MKKRFIPSIYLYRGNAVRSLADVTETGTDPVALAKSYCDNGADALMIFDMSETDEEHEKSLDIMKEICGSVSVSVIGAGNVKRLEDIKKILYTGCKKAVLDYSKPSNIEITEEASLRFGREKLMISLQDTEILSCQKEKIEKFVSALLLMNPHQVSAAQSVSTMPYMVQASQLELNKLMELLSQDNLFGVTGNVINDNAKEIASLKKMCEENGLTINALEAAISFDELKTDKDGLVPVVIQDYKTNEVLMVAYMNKTAFEDTLRTGKMNYYSRSRKEQWLKGETSGHFQYVKSLTTDCDKDTILAKVLQMGVACHTGSRSCFFNEIVPADYEEEENPLKVFENVFNVIKDRKVNPKEGSYTNYLFDKGIDKILKKIGEEATEIVIAAKNPNPNEVKYEISDFLYHMMVLMAERDITWEDITTELANR